MHSMVERGKPPLTPHHTQAIIVLMMSRFFRAIKDERAEHKKAFIAQMSTGEGKSVVISILSIFMAKQHGQRVFVLENNEGLMNRDYKQSLVFFNNFGITSGKGRAGLDHHGTSIVYCLKPHIEKYLLDRMYRGQFNLGETVLIVDEVDDLVINEKPTSFYSMPDTALTESFAKSIEIIHAAGQEVGPGSTPLPGPDDPSEKLDVWWEAMLKRCPRSLQEENEPGGDFDTGKKFQPNMMYMEAMMAIRDAARRKEEGVDWRKKKMSSGKEDVEFLIDGKKPKVNQTAPWFSYVAWREVGAPLKFNSLQACVCTPFLFQKFGAIFGLTGSVGGKQELKYLIETYHAVKFDVPRFLDTCDPPEGKKSARQDVTNKGVDLVEGQQKLIERVAGITAEHFKNVPVLIITSSRDELRAIYEQLSGSEDMRVGGKTHIQWFAENNQEGRKTTEEETEEIIRKSTIREGGNGSAFCQVTVTDMYGGRGHDFQNEDKTTIERGGMLVIVTSIPNEREWIQWKGRTARQDKPGAFWVVLNKKAESSQESEKERAATVKRLGNISESYGKPELADQPCQRIQVMLDFADQGGEEKIKKYKGMQVWISSTAPHAIPASPSIQLDCVTMDASGGWRGSQRRHYPVLFAPAKTIRYDGLRGQSRQGSLAME